MSGDEVLETIHRRDRFLSAVADGARSKRDLVAAMDVSRSTVDRAIRDLEAVSLVERTDDGYVATAAGRIVAADRERYRRTVESVTDARSLLALLPSDAEVPPAMVRGATVMHATAPTPAAPLEEVRKRIAGSDRYRGVAAIAPGTGFAELYREQVVEEGLDLELVFTEALAAYAREHYGEQWRTMHERGVEVYAVGDVPHGLGIVEDDDGACAMLPVYDAQTQLAGVVFNDEPVAVEWAREQYARTSERAHPVEPPAAGRGHLAGEE
jgi:predicted transcriptional regulator